MTSIRELAKLAADKAREDQQMEVQQQINKIAHDWYISCLLDAVVVFLVDLNVKKMTDALDASKEAYLTELAASKQLITEIRIDAELQAVRDYFLFLVDQQRAQFVRIGKIQEQEAKSGE